MLRAQEAGESSKIGKTLVVTQTDALLTVVWPLSTRIVQPGRLQAASAGQGEARLCKHRESKVKLDRPRTPLTRSAAVPAAMANPYAQPLDLATLLVEVAGSTFAFNNKIKGPAIKALWDSLCACIATTLKAQKGVLLPNLGNFRVGPVVGESRKKIRPIFALLEGRYGGVSQERARYIIGEQRSLAQKMTSVQQGARQRSQRRRAGADRAQACLLVRERRWASSHCAAKLQSALHAVWHTQGGHAACHRRASAATRHPHPNWSTSARKHPTHALSAHIRDTHFEPASNHTPHTDYCENMCTMLRTV